jgi:lipoprotein LpqH
MIRSGKIAAAATAILVAGLTGCSSDKTSDSAATDQGTAVSPTSETASSPASVTAAAGTAKVTIDGQTKELQGQVVCAVAGGSLNIGIGEQTTGVAVVMAQDGSSVTSVALGNVNGVVLGFQQGASGGNASATKDGNNYTITGNATGVDMANPMQPMTKPFEVQVSCP